MATSRTSSHRLAPILTWRPAFVVTESQRAAVPCPHSSTSSVSPAVHSFSRCDSRSGIIGFCLRTSRFFEQSWFWPPHHTMIALQHLELTAYDNAAWLPVVGPAVEQSAGRSVPHRFQLSQWCDSYILVLPDHYLSCPDRLHDHTSAVCPRHWFASTQVLCTFPIGICNHEYIELVRRTKEELLLRRRLARRGRCLFPLTSSCDLCAQSPHVRKPLTSAHRGRSEGLLRKPAASLLLFTLSNCSASPRVICDRRT